MADSIFCKEIPEQSLDQTLFNRCISMQLLPDTDQSHAEICRTPSSSWLAATQSHHCLHHWFWLRRLHHWPATAIILSPTCLKRNTTPVCATFYSADDVIVAARISRLSVVVSTATDHTESLSVFYHLSGWTAVITPVCECVEVSQRPKNTCLPQTHVHTHMHADRLGVMGRQHVGNVRSASVNQLLCIRGPGVHVYKTCLHVHIYEQVDSVQIKSDCETPAVEMEEEKSR